VFNGVRDTGGSLPRRRSACEDSGCTAKEPCAMNLWRFPQSFERVHSPIAAAQCIEVILGDRSASCSQQSLRIRPFHSQIGRDGGTTTGTPRSPGNGPFPFAQQTACAVRQTEWVVRTINVLTHGAYDSIGVVLFSNLVNWRSDR
jgi:hypothetical protein